MRRRFILILSAGFAVAVSGWVLAVGGGGGQVTLPTTKDDYFMPGSQPFIVRVPCAMLGNPCDDGNPYTENDICADVDGEMLCTGDPLFEPFAGAQTQCNFCHGNNFSPTAPFEAWKTSMMAQAARDPVFHAALAVAEQDAEFSGDTCLRCHAPRAWMEGRSDPTDGALLSGQDFEGVTCHICHRMIDPVYADGVNPVDDQDELNFVTAEFGPVVENLHNGAFILDRLDRRRGPIDLDADYTDFNFHEWRQSPYHREALLCATCHDVSIPTLTRDQIGGPNAPTDTYSLNTVGAPHENFDKFDMFPEQRTYTEWLMSDFADGPIDMGGRFGGDNPLVSSCQDCHMPDILGSACNPMLSPEVPERPDLPQHFFLGAGNWVLDAILDLDQSLELYDLPSFLTQDEVDDAKARNLAFMQAAADMDLTFTVDNDLNVRITNQCGHKLPTGYNEGRRVWLNVKFADASESIVQEHGAYDTETAVLDDSDTKVYQSKLGMDASVAAATGLPEGESFHLVLNNEYLLDNRIPPRGFTNAEADASQTSPVGYSYADGQHWDDTEFDIPCNAANLDVTLYYQSTSREYAEFLRDTNVTDNRGQIMYDQWEANGKSAPLTLLNQSIDLADCNLNGSWDACDIASMASDDLNENGIPDECECTTFEDCADMDDSGIRDDNCVWWACEAGGCVPTAVPYGDLGGANGACPPDQVADGNDRFHALNCFSNQDTLAQVGYPCEAASPAAYNVDAAGLANPCLADGVCDANDAFAAINAFSGSTTCSCPLGGPAPQAPDGGLWVVDHADISLDARPVIQPGGHVEVAVRLDGGVSDLRGYQLHLGVSGGARGALELVDIVIEDRKDWVFASESPWQAFNVDAAQAIAGLDASGVRTPRRGGYLATFVYQATRDAGGTFVVELLHDDQDQAHRTRLFATPSHGIIALEQAQPIEISVAGKPRERVGRR